MSSFVLKKCLKGPIAGREGNWKNLPFIFFGAKLFLLIYFSKQILTKYAGYVIIRYIKRLEMVLWKKG